MVAIKDMETPRWCGECPMCREETIESDTYTYCTLLNQDITWNGNRVDDCPLVEIGTCKDCKHWKDSDGVYRRGIGAESKCPINNSRVFDGTFCCADFEKRGNKVGWSSLENIREKVERGDENE